MTWKKLMSHPVFAFFILFIVLALTGSLSTLAALISVQLAGVINALAYPVLLIGLIILAFRKMIGGGGKGRGHH